MLVAASADINGSANGEGGNVGWGTNCSFRSSRGVKDKAEGLIECQAHNLPWGVNIVALHLIKSPSLNTETLHGRRTLLKSNSQSSILWTNGLEAKSRKTLAAISITCQVVKGVSQTPLHCFLLTYYLHENQVEKINYEPYVKCRAHHVKNIISTRKCMPEVMLWDLSLKCWFWINHLQGLNVQTGLLRIRMMEGIGTIAEGLSPLSR